MQRFPIEIVIRIKNAEGLNELIKQIDKVTRDNPDTTIKTKIEIVSDDILGAVTPVNIL